MGWEWRCFVKAEGAVDLISATAANAEERTDTYHALTRDFGLKRRGGASGWELKVCTKREGGVEKFKKHRLSSSAGLESFLDADQCALEMFKQTPRWVTLEKVRVQTRVGGGVGVPFGLCAQQLVFEQTDIVVEIDGRQLGTWRSFCVEGGDAVAILEFVNATPELQKLVESNGDGSPASGVMGYPAFVEKLAKNGTLMGSHLYMEAGTSAAAFSTPPKTAAASSMMSDTDDGGPGCGDELWVVRHGERVDETAGYSAWRLATPSHRRFDPELTSQGAQQARDVAEFLLQRTATTNPNIPVAPSTAAEKFGYIVYTSPLSRTLSTAHEIAQALEKNNTCEGGRNSAGSGGGGGGASVGVAKKGKVEVRVVFGLSECAAAVQREGEGFRQKLSFLDLEAMQALCPQVTGIEEQAPETFAEACTWLVQQARRRGQRPACCLVVTHREGIKDLMEKQMRLPYCALARFRADDLTLPAHTSSSKSRSESAGPPGAIVGNTQFNLLSLSDRDGSPLMAEQSFAQRPAPKLSLREMEARSLSKMKEQASCAATTNS